MISAVLPQKLSPGDTVALVAPSEPVEKEQVSQTGKFLETLGYKFKPGKHLFFKIGDYTAGTIEDRAEDLNAAFADPEIKAILMANGGYAADQVLSLLDYDLISKNPKIFIGFSDATILQLAFLTKCGLVTFHGPNFGSIYEAPEYTLQNLWPVVTKSEMTNIISLNKWEVLRNGKGKGTLIGGNLDTMCSILGTSYDPFPNLPNEKIILFFEEYEESYNRIIRRLFQLKHAGIFERCEAMLVGKLVDCNEEDGYVGVPELRYTLLQMARSYDFPIIWNADFGHTPEKFTIPIGVEGEIDTKTLSFKFNPAVS